MSNQTRHTPHERSILHRAERRIIRARLRELSEPDAVPEDDSALEVGAELQDDDALRWLRLPKRAPKAR